MTEARFTPGEMALARVIAEAVYQQRPNAGLPMRADEAAWLARAVLAEGYGPAAPDLYEALRDCMIGGNHLANALVHRLGPSFSSKWPPDTDHNVVLEGLGSGVNYDMWCCWSALMRARAALAKAQGVADTLQERADGENA